MLLIDSRSRRRLALVLALLVAGVATYLCCIPALRSKTGYNVSSAECPFDIPSQATNVCYYRREAFGPASFCEFNCTPESFLAWTKSKGWEAKRIGEQPCRIPRYERYVPREGAGEKPTASWAEVTHGYFYERMSQPDAGIHVAYDLDSGRGYYYAHTR